MKFVDTLTLTVTAGHGGKGCVSFRREKFVPKGGPDGGNGGDGGSVIVRGDKSKLTLLDLRHKKKYAAPNGEAGRGRDQTGRRGNDLIIPVPFGTIIYDEDTGEALADISDRQPQYMIAQGGKGGRGNASFASPTHRAPRTSEGGTAGQTRNIRLELKLIADVGIIGYPNAGKSTFISTVSAAKPKVADYPFTTLAPVLGVVKDFTGNSFVIADIPGLIEGAHTGAGLGLRFLRHIERTHTLLHFVDASEQTSMISRYLTIRKELALYSDEVAAKPEIIVGTKADAAVAENVEEFGTYINSIHKPFFMISSLSKQGVTELLSWISKVLAETAPAEETDKPSF